jgi:hypothetical protein
MGKTSGKQIVEFGLRVGSGSYKALLKQLEERLGSNKNAIRLVEKILYSKTLSQGSEIVWFRYEGVGKNALSAKLLDDIYGEHVLNDSEWEIIWSKLMGSSGGEIRAHWIPQTLQALSPINLPPPKVDLIPAFREVKKGSASEGDLSGVGLIDKLMELQAPELERLRDRDRFDGINQFLQTVVGNPNAMLKIPHTKETILVEMDGKTLPLTSLGTGIHEVIIMAAAGTVLQNQVLCIEEPEIHLHPFLQKQLLKYLNENTSNQYFISTHSAHILDTPDAVVFHVTLENGESRVEIALSDTDKSRICDDLGYRSSDLLQANCVVWVEGPSDRIYLNHWIRSISSESIEGLHYSIMFYGGRLLKHLSANDPEVDDFISLRRLNRHISIVIDSDKSDENDDINETKNRVSGEFNNGPGFAWVTEGRVIENYINKKLLEQAIKNVHPSVVKIRSAGKYDNPLESPEVSSGTADFKVDKVKVAKEVVKEIAQLNVFDLNEKVEKIVKFVREANGMDTAS